MAKKAKQMVKMQMKGGEATPAPPVGTMLGSTGINIGDFVKRFNEETAERKGEVVPVVISVYDDRTFSFTTKISPVSSLILKEMGIAKGSSKNLVKKVGKIDKSKIKEIAEKKMQDLNANDIDAASKIVEGTARSMGIEVSN